MINKLYRSAVVSRATGETRVAVSLALAPGAVEVGTGLPFFDHLLGSLAFYARWSLDLKCSGDLQVDDHHSVEDCALALGLGLRDALGDRAGIRRFGCAYAPLDESLARAVVDISGRPHSVVKLGLRRENIGTMSCENIAHAVASLANAALVSVHLDVIRGANDHHRAEAAFKALGLALREAVSFDCASVDRSPIADSLRPEAFIPSLKGSLAERGLADGNG